MHEKIPQRCRQARLQLGWSRRAAAARLGWAESTVYKYERLTTNELSAYSSIAKCYGCTLDWLVTGELPMWRLSLNNMALAEILDNVGHLSPEAQRSLAKLLIDIRVNLLG